jgi:hypothetical protein
VLQNFTKIFGQKKVIIQNIKKEKKKKSEYINVSIDFLFLRQN